MTDFILVHGGVHGSWCWEPVLGPLAERGHRVHAVDLPGRDGQPKDVTLDDWVDAVGRHVDRVLEQTGTPPVLVGHSMGGLSVSQLAERRPDDVAAIVYVCALVPEDGVTGLEALSEAGPECRLLEEGAITPVPDGLSVVVAPDAARRAFYNRCSPEVTEWAVERLCTEPVVPLTTALALGSAFDRVPKAWVIGMDDQCVPPTFQQSTASRLRAPSSTIDSDHSPSLSAPGELVECLLTVGLTTMAADAP